MRPACEKGLELLTHSLTLPSPVTKSAFRAGWFKTFCERYIHDGNIFFFSPPLLNMLVVCVVHCHVGRVESPIHAAKREKVAPRPRLVTQWDRCIHLRPLCVPAPPDSITRNPKSPRSNFFVKSERGSLDCMEYMHAYPHLDIDSIKTCFRV